MRTYKLIISILLLGIITSCKKQINQKAANSSITQGNQNEVTNTISEQNSHDGIWEIEKRKKTGEWKKGEKYYYTQEEFGEKYKNLQIVIKDAAIIISNPYDCSADYKVIKEPEMLVSGTTKKDFDLFLENELHIDPKTYLGYISTNCKYPLTNIYVFKDYLVLKEYGAFFYVLSKKIKEPGASITQEKIHCYKKEDERNYTFSEICEYENSTDIEYLYQQILTKYNPEDLLKKIPMRDTTYSTSKVSKIQYKISLDTIKIKQRFEGGETDYLVYKKKGNGITEERLMPD